jgi:transcriptional regulator with XRE-family HTH domain
VATSDIMEYVGGRVRAAREHAGLTIPELAKKMDTTPSFLQEIEEGGGVRARMLLRLSEVLKIDATSFFQEEIAPRS